MASKNLDFRSNTFKVLGLAFQYCRVINREVKFSAVFDWKIYQIKFIAIPSWNGRNYKDIMGWFKLFG